MEPGVHDARQVAVLEDLRNPLAIVIAAIQRCSDPDVVAEGGRLHIRKLDWGAEHRGERTTWLPLLDTGPRPGPPPSLGSDLPMQQECVLLEPSATLRGACMRVLEPRGINTIQVEDVGSALQVICQRRPTLVISSAMLPTLPGSSLVAALRESPRHRSTPIAVLSGSVESFERNSHFAPDAVITKDGSLQKNLGAFLDELGLSDVVQGQPATEAVKETPSLHGRVILLAEDSPVNKLATSRILHVAGAEVVAVTNGLEALEALKDCSFDLVLMDIEMPELDGKDATRAMRGSGLQLPILALTGHDSEEFAEEALNLGFTAVLPKVLPRGELVRSCIAHLAE